MKFSTAVLIALVIAVPIHAQITSQWSISENQLPTNEGGRVNSIAINPEASNERFVASDSGGLFKSIDGGLHWQHVTSLPVIFTQSVAYIPAKSIAPNVVLVSAKADFKVRNGGGIWRSDDGGATWTQTLFDPDPDDRLSAYEISVQPRSGNVYAGTSKGIALSTDGGLSWSTMPAFPAGRDQTVYSVLATSAAVHFGGPSGVRVDTGAGPRTPVGDPGRIEHMHAFGAWAERRYAFAVNALGQVHLSSDNGLAWRRLASAPPAAGRCNGTPFIKAAARVEDVREWLFLHLSDRCGLRIMFTPVVPAGDVAQQMDFDESWQVADIDRGAPRDLAFVNREPVMLGTTAGLHRNAVEDVVWRLVGGGREGGYNALQINEVKGQNVDGQRTDLYLGTRDNGIVSWSLQNDSLRSFASEGHFVELERRVQATGTCRVTFEVGQQTFKSPPRLEGPDLFPDHPNRREAPVLLRPGHFVQAVTSLQPLLQRGMAQSENCGQPFRPFAFFSEMSVGLARLAHAGDDNTLTTLYQPYRSADDALKLMRIERFRSSTGTADARFPQMSYFESLGINPHMSDAYPVYGVDPANPLHVIAPNTGSGEKMMFTPNGGGEWFDLSDLTILVKGGVPAKRLFRSDLNETAAGKVFPVVTAVSFSPQDPNLVLVGTSEGGIYVSHQNGAPETWFAIPNTEGATYVTSFFWENANTVYVSTFGRGLWKLTNRRSAADVPSLCPDCDVVSTDGGSTRPPFDHGALIFDGQILGVRTDSGKLREVLVTPGSSVVFIGESKDLQEDIAITESDGRDDSKFEPLPKGPDGWLATGVVFTGDDELTGAAFAKSELTLFEPERVEMPKDSTDSPTKGAPYLYLSASSYAPQEAVELSATDYTAGASYEVLIDGVPVKDTVTADGAGAFIVKVAAPSKSGYHRIAVRMAGDETVIDSAMFVVRN
jgi:hypothetical protein